MMDPFDYIVQVARNARGRQLNEHEVALRTRLDQVGRALFDRIYQGTVIAHDAPQTPWQVLGVERGASQEEVKAARNRLAHLYHPDLPSGGDPDMMKRVNAAFETCMMMLKDGVQ